MTLAYLFWHRPRPDASGAEYESGLNQFHQRLADGSITGFVASWSLRVPDRPWLPGGGYEDWYLVDDFAALGTLGEHAVDAARQPAHDEMARAVLDGTGGIYALLTGPATARSGWAGWFTKRVGVSYPQLRTELDEQMDAGTLVAVWQRQLVLGPAPEFLLLGPRPVTVRDADLLVGGPVIMSG